MPIFHVSFEIEGSATTEADSIDEAMDIIRDDWGGYETRRRFWVDERNERGLPVKSLYHVEPDS